MSNETRVMLFPNDLLVATNAVLPQHLELPGMPINESVTGVALNSFLYAITYIGGNLEGFNQEAIRDLPIISMIIVEGIVLKVEADNTVAYFADGTVNLTPHEGDTFIVLPDIKLTVDILGETTTIREAEDIIDLSTAPYITPQMLGAFAHFSVKSWTQLANFSLENWIALGGVNDLDAYEECMLYAAAASQAFWEEL